MIDYDYDALTEGMDEEPGDVEAPVRINNKEYKNYKDYELDDSIQRFKSYLQGNDLKMDKTKLHLHLESLLAEKSRREKVGRNGASSSLPQGLSGGIDVVLSLTDKDVKEKKMVDEFAERKCSPSTNAFAPELKYYKRGRKQNSDTDHTTKHWNLFPSTPLQTKIPDRAKQSSQVSAADDLTVKKNKGSPHDAVVVFSSDDENDVKIMEREPPCSRRTSLRISERRKVDSSRKIAYPSKDDPDAVEIYYGDFTRLRPAEFLNDTVIDFYIKYLQREALDDEQKDKCHFYSSFFFKKLEEAFETEAKQGEAFFKLRKWTRGIDIFSKSYLFLPINDRLHWSLCIVCFSLSEGSLTPYIFHLDSLEAGHPSREIFKYIQRYLELEHAESEIAINIKWRDIVKRRVEVPRQENEYDCGLFLLYYIKTFLKIAPLPCNLKETTGLFGKRWFKPLEASMLRGTIKKILEKLFIDAEEDEATLG